MEEGTTIGIDLSKSIMQVCVVGEDGEVIEERRLRRDRLEAAVSKHPGALVAMEACGGAHHWGRRFEELGHRVKLLPAKAVKAYCDDAVKDDRRDARAIAEAGRHGYVKAITVKSRQAQALQTLDRVEQVYDRQHTQLGNALRSHLAEFGLVVAKGPHHLRDRFPELIEREELPEELRPVLEDLYQRYLAAGEALAEAKARIARAAKADRQARLTMTAPGVGPHTAVAVLALIGDPHRFDSARHFACWIGLTPKLYKSGKTCWLGPISKRGNKRLRSLLVMGAQSLLQYCERGYYKGDKIAEWARRLLKRKPRNLVVVALANKLARIIWRILASQRPYEARTA